MISNINNVINTVIIISLIYQIPSHSALEAVG